MAMAVGMATLACACSTPDNGQHPFSRGWRTGEIEMLGSSTTRFPLGAIDCRIQHVGGEPAESLYAYVQFDFRSSGKFFGSNPKQRHIIAPVAPGTRIAEGTTVLVNLKDCTQPVVPRKDGS
ncbi:hypothetical protein [Massilia putida]|uniref:hypothetical protein n=1 Tax=Massilia putida TaxID=1141883 RepID=UPI0012EBDCE6|nr:hypothetical protein [Massilia putida]